MTIGQIIISSGQLRQFLPSKQNHGMGNRCTIIYLVSLESSSSQKEQANGLEIDFRHHKTVKNVIFIKNERYFGHNSLQNVKIAKHHIFVGLKKYVPNIGGQFRETLASS